MIVSDFTVASQCTPSNTIILGTTATISFKVKRESGDTFNNALYIWFPTGHGESLIYMDTAFSIAAGKTVEVSVQSRQFSSDYIESLLQSSRAYPRSSWGVQFGAWGTRTNVTFPVNIVQGWLPKIEYFSAVRCSDGTESDEGESLLCGLRLSTSAAADPEVMSLNLYYASGVVTAASQVIPLTGSIAQALEGIADSESLVTQSFSNGSDWNFMLAFGDAYEQAVVYTGVARAFANVHLSGCSTGGVAFGKFSSAAEGNPKFECEYPAVFSAGIVGMPRIELGLISLDENISSGDYVDYTITFAQAFESAPLVICGFNSNSTAGGFGRCCVASHNVTESGCVARVFNGDGSARKPNICWVALGT